MVRVPGSTGSASSLEGGRWIWLLLVWSMPLPLLFRLSRLLPCTGYLVAAMRSRIAVPSKGAPSSSSEVLVLRGCRVPSGTVRDCCASTRVCRDVECDCGADGSAADSPPGRIGEVCDGFVASETAGAGAAGNRGEQSDALEAGVLGPKRALGVRLKLVELRLLPRDRASTRPSNPALKKSCAAADGGFLVSLLRRCELALEPILGLSISRPRSPGRGAKKHTVVIKNQRNIQRTVSSQTKHFVGWAPG
jgi:hypothetical protein